MLNRWGILIVGFILCFVALEIYQNTSVMDQGYLIQELKLQRKALREENGHLQSTLASSLSLNRLDHVARERLDLTQPATVRFLEDGISPPVSSSSPPPAAFSTSPSQLLGDVFRRLQQFVQTRGFSR